MKRETTGALSFISKVLGKKKLYIVGLLLIQALLGVLGVSYAWLMRGVIDAAVAGNREQFWYYVLYFVSLVALQLALRAVLRFLQEYARSTYENQFKERLFSVLLTREYAKVTAIHSGEWMNRLTSDTVVVADALATIVPGVTGMTVRLVGALGMILYFEPKVVFVIVPAGLLMCGFTYAFRMVLKRLHKTMQEKDGVVRTFLQEQLESQMVVRAFSVEQDVVSEASNRMGAHMSARMKKNHFSNICNIGFGVAMNGAYAMGLIYCGYRIMMGTMSYGTLMAMLQLISQIQNPFANITGYLPKYYAMLASAERLMEAENFDICAKDNSSCEWNGIVMDKVSFSYDGARNILSDFSLEIKPGEFVAFTGESGCGKSTVLKLLLGLYKPISGSVYPSSVSCFAYVPQENYLMSDTIRAVVALADKESLYDEERLKRALFTSCAEFVYDLPEGLDTVLGERGLGLSEGQMQRIAIARAIYSERPVLLLDESTSALDENTEKQVLHRLKSMTDRTVIIVTHRPAARSICDKEIRFEKEGEND